MSEIKQSIDNVIDDFKGRFRNPLILSFILVWCYIHWRLLFTFFSENDHWFKKFYIQTYIHLWGWWGMIGLPLLVSVASLLSFYILGSIGQVIRIWAGVRLPAFLNAKFDKGKYVIKFTYLKTKKKLEIAQTQLVKLNSIVFEHFEQRDRDSHKISALQDTNNILLSQNRDYSDNINYNLNFRKQFEQPLMYLLAFKYNIAVMDKLNPLLSKDDFNFFNGNWSIITSATIGEDSGNVSSLIFKEGKLYYEDETRIGEILELVYDRNNRILYLRVKYFKENSDVKFYLIRENKDRFIGFRDNLYIVMERFKAS